MGRKSKHSKDEFRELAISKMEAHLVNAPAREMSLRKLAAQIDYTPGMLLSVFKTQALFLLEVNSRTLDELTCFLESYHADELHTVEGALCSLALGYLEFAEKNKYRWQMVFEHKMPAGEPVPLWMQNKIDGLFNTISKHIPGIGEDGDEQHMELASKTLWASVHGITQLSLDNKLFVGNDLDGRAMIEALIKNFCLGLRCAKDNS